MMYSRKFLLFLTLGVCGACAANPPADWSDAEFERQNGMAKAACAAENHAEAIRIWQPWAERGQPRAQSNLGYVYLKGCTDPVKNNGYGPERDIPKGLALLEQAAAQKVPQAQYLLGDWLYSPASGASERQRGLQLLEQAAGQGHLLAQTSVAHAYAMAGDYEKSFYWNEQAARQGDADAQGKTANMLSAGQGTPRDCGQALYWAGRSAAQGDGETMRMLSDWYGKGSACVRQDAAKAREWAEKAEAAARRRD